MSSSQDRMEARSASRDDAMEGDAQEGAKATAPSCTRLPASALGEHPSVADRCRFIARFSKRGR
jgi:hypothetical protein